MAEWNRMLVEARLQGSHKGARHVLDQMRQPVVRHGLLPMLEHGLRVAAARRIARIFSLHHRLRCYMSITSSSPRARDTQIMMLSARSLSASTRSRWSASPAISLVRQVPQVPLSQELAA